ncbi:hypothetical protein [Rubricoccus marinus]|uniref:Uncharacterized protein n=1 Tax=Rubricoccus marinus TaxID=716817 RepID=A0A259TXB6_9BACT|nr:hypothetical protein [Rubricoccus marinus]OZC02340.1 hypothetical protein BSZ36_04720 [Rubricoccus marinus]
MSRLFLALALLSLGACASDEAPDPVTPEAAAAPELAATTDVAAMPEAEAPTEELALTDATPPTPEVASPPDSDAAASGGATITFANDTGMAITALHLVACGENEGEDWSTMREWAYDYIEAPLAPGATVEVEISAECLMALPVWEDGTEVMEKILVEGDMTHAFLLG